MYQDRLATVPEQSRGVALPRYLSQRITPVLVASVRDRDTRKSVFLNPAARCIALVPTETRVWLFYLFFLVTSASNVVFVVIHDPVKAIEKRAPSHASAP